MTHKKLCDTTNKQLPILYTNGSAKWKHKGSLGNAIQQNERWSMDGRHAAATQMFDTTL